MRYVVMLAQLGLTAYVVKRFTQVAPMVECEHEQKPDLESGFVGFIQMPSDAVLPEPEEEEGRGGYLRNGQAR